MAFTLDLWKQQAGARLTGLQQWLTHVRQAKTPPVPYLLYGFLGSMGLWPLVTAAQSGELLPVMLALGSSDEDGGGHPMGGQCR